MDGWQQIMTGTGDVALTAPDGTKVTIKSFTALDKDKMSIGAYGLGRGARFTMSDLGWSSGFLMYNTLEAEVPANVCGWQSSYGNSRRAQLVMGTDGRLHARFSLSTEIVDKTTEWRQLLFRWEQTPRFEWGIEVSNKPKDDGSGRIAYLGANSAPNNAGNGAVYLINRLGNKALQLMDNGTINFDNKDIPVFGQPNVNFGSGFKVSNTAGSQTYVTWSLANLGRPSTDNGGIVSFEISNTTGRPYLLQRRNDGTFTDQIVNGLPTAGGVLAVQGTSGREYKRDIADADATEALNRINELRFVNYVYKDDEQNRERFGFIAEEVEQIAPQYIKHMQELVEEILDPDTKEIIDRVYRDRPCVDNNPIVMDLLGAIQALTSKVNEQEARLLALEKYLIDK
ncbi:tail fiber domain-containing protein [Hafnia alvei]|nr:tail fiber domain-containing protein [Hafnia alvei]